MLIAFPEHSNLDVGAFFQKHISISNILIESIAMLTKRWNSFPFEHGSFLKASYSVSRISVKCVSANCNSVTSDSSGYDSFKICLIFSPFYYIWSPIYRMRLFSSSIIFFIYFDCFICFCCNHASTRHVKCNTKYSSFTIH